MKKGTKKLLVWGAVGAGIWFFLKKKREEDATKALATAAVATESAQGQYFMI